MNKLYQIFIKYILLFIFLQCTQCQKSDVVSKNNEIKEIIKRIVVQPSSKTVPQYTTTGYFPTSSSGTNYPTKDPINKPNINGTQTNNNSTTLNNNSTLSNNSTLTTNTTLPNNSTTIDIGDEYQIPMNWTTGYSTHYGPFPSNPQFSEIGYQPNDVGVGCSNGYPGGDPEWLKILANGTYPAPNIVNHEKTVWPVVYTVAVSAAVWNRDDICWQKLSIRNHHHPEYKIEAYVVDFCPIGYCLWKDEYLARNIDLYGEKAWVALGGDISESKMKIDIEWPKGVVPHDAIKLSGSISNKFMKKIRFLTLTPFVFLITYYLY